MYENLHHSKISRYTVYQTLLSVSEVTIVARSFVVAHFGTSLYSWL